MRSDAPARAFLTALLSLLFLLHGCGARVDENDQRAVREEFSPQQYDQAMTQLGKGEEAARERSAREARTREEGHPETHQDRVSP